MRYARRGETVWVAFDAPAAGLTGVLGVTVMTPLGEVLVARSTDGVSEVVPGKGIYTAAVTLPDEDGTYLVLGDDGTNTPDGSTGELFLVSSSGAPAIGSGDDLPDWAPSLREVAHAVPAYTRGSFDDDVEDAGAEQGTFTDRTQPSADTVAGMIFVACEEIEGRVGFEVPERCYKLARTAAIWHVAAVISASKIPAQTEEARGEYRAHIARYLADLEELVTQARQPWAMRLA